MCIQVPCVYLLSAASTVIRNSSVTSYIYVIHKHRDLVASGAHSESAGLSSPLQEADKGRIIIMTTVRIIITIITQNVGPRKQTAGGCERGSTLDKPCLIPTVLYSTVHLHTMSAMSPGGVLWIFLYYMHLGFGVRLNCSKNMYITLHNLLHF